MIKHTFRLRGAAVCGCTLALLTACAPRPAAPEAVPAADEIVIGDAALGAEIYETGGSSGVPCLACHTLDGAQLVGPTFQGMGERAATRIEGMSAEQYLHQSIVNPGAHVVDGFSNSMNQNYGEQLTPEEVSHLVAFLLEQ